MTVINPLNIEYLFLNKNLGQPLGHVYWGFDEKSKCLCADKRRTWMIGGIMIGFFSCVTIFATLVMRHSHTVANFS